MYSFNVDLSCLQNEFSKTLYRELFKCFIIAIINMMYDSWNCIKQFKVHEKDKMNGILCKN